MNAQELRIGNLINYKVYDKVDPRKEWLEVSKIDAQDLIFLEKSPDNIDYRPIPLTEEVITKFGFNCINRPKMFFKLYHNNENADFSSLILKEVGNNPIWVYAGNNRWTINPFTVEIKYAHQLQNLYFALTGTEL